MSGYLLLFWMIKLFKALRATLYTRVLYKNWSFIRRNYRTIKKITANFRVHFSAPWTYFALHLTFATLFFVIFLSPCSAATSLQQPSTRITGLYFFFTTCELLPFTKNDIYISNSLAKVFSSHLRPFFASTSKLALLIQ